MCLTLRPTSILSAIILWLSLCGGANAVCVYSFAQLGALINLDIVSGVPGGVVAPTLNSVMNAQNNCYVNTQSINPATLIALGIAPNTTGGFATWLAGIGFDNPAALAAGAIPPSITDTNVIVVVGTPASPSPGTCSLNYHIGTSTPTGTYGEVLNAPSGVYWEPQYSNSPVQACEFGSVADGGFQDAGFSFTATANGTNTLASTGIGAEGNITN